MVDIPPETYLSQTNLIQIQFDNLSHPRQSVFTESLTGQLHDHISVSNQQHHSIVASVLINLVAMTTKDFLAKRERAERF